MVVLTGEIPLGDGERVYGIKFNEEWRAARGNSIFSAARFLTHIITQQGLTPPPRDELLGIALDMPAEGLGEQIDPSQYGIEEIR